MELDQTSPARDEAWGVIKVLSADECERMLAEDREKTRRDIAAYYETGYLEGREKGLQEGWEKGLQEGRETGRQEGREKGPQDFRRAAINNMVQQGLTFEQISSFLMITLDDVKALAEN